MTISVNSGAHQLSFPVLCLSQDSSIQVADSQERLERCNARAFFTTRYFEGMVLFDSSGNRFRVIATSLVSPEAGVRRWITRASNGEVKVRLQLEREALSSVDAAKHEVLDCIEKAPDFWEASRDLGEWRQLVRDARTMRDLLTLLR